MEKFSKLMENTFKLRENGTTVKTEIIAGVTTFMTMAYILAVNPNILSSTGMDHGAVFTATALAAFLGTLLMALFANYPFALAPGMGLNAYFAYTVVLGYGYSWQAALTAVFAEGIIFIVLSLTNVREAIFNSIPVSLKSAVSVGIGLFIAFIGLQNAKIVLPNSSTVAGLYSLSSYNANLQSAATLNGTEYVAGTFNDVGITVLLAVIGVILTAVLVVRNVKGNILWGILATWILGMICQACGLYVPNPANGFYSLFPDFSNGLSIPSLAPIFGKLDFSILKTGEFFVIMFAFLFVDMFDTIGTLIGVSSKANMLDKNGKLPRIKGALMADAVATCAGAVLGTSTTTTFVESASGVTEGGRTGLTAITTGVFFLLSLLFTPLFLMIPSIATAPALVMVGIFMIEPLMHVDLSDTKTAFPVFICVAFMAFTFNIAYGILFGLLAYTGGQVFAGNARKLPISTWILTGVFLLYLLLEIFFN